MTTDSYYHNEVTQAHLISVLNGLIEESRNSPSQAHTFYDFFQRCGWINFIQWTLILTGQQAGSQCQISSTDLALNAQNIALTIDYVLNIAISEVTQKSSIAIENT